MLDILKDKRLWIGLVVAILFVIGIASAVQLINKSKETDGSQKSNLSSDVDEEAEDADKPYDGEGMEVVDDSETQEDSMEVPKSWDDTKQDSTDKSDGTEQEKDENVSDEDTLKDDTSWGTIF